MRDPEFLRQAQEETISVGEWIRRLIDHCVVSSQTAGRIPVEIRLSHDELREFARYLHNHHPLPQAPIAFTRLTYRGLPVIVDDNAKSIIREEFPHYT